MARPNYGPGELAGFDNFPDQIRVVIDSGIANNSELFVDGQNVVLESTPSSGMQKGSKVVGEPLPEKRIVYSDTGSDTDLSLKISYYGWGEFLLNSEMSEDYYTLEVTQGIAIQTGDWESEKLFEKVKKALTQIPVTESMSEEFGINIARSEDDLPDLADYDFDIYMREDGVWWIDRNQDGVPEHRDKDKDGTPDAYDWDFPNYPPTDDNDSQDEYDDVDVSARCVPKIIRSDNRLIRVNADCSKEVITTIEDDVPSGAQLNT